ncbi:tetratricopeptide repeat protein [candidate division KSB1 bacterium]|nr:tetratricopeptide repeat protein [candidate division KSB1 bacterium]
MLKNHKLQSRAPGSFPCLNLDELLAFSSGKISAPQKHEIENHLAHCTLCSDGIEGIADLPDKDQIRPIIHSLRERIHQHVQESRVKQRHWRIYYRVAAVLLIGLSMLLYIFTQKPQHEILFNKYFKPYPNIISITRGENSEVRLKQGLVEYEFENYQEAIQIFEQITRSEPQNVTAQFYLGIAHLCLNQPDPAFAQFQSVIAIGENPFVEPAQWYLGLAALKKGNLNQANTIFDNLRTESRNYKQQSSELLNSLEKMRQ